MNEPREQDPASHRVPSWIVIAGGVPLLVAMAVEFVGVIGRNAGLPVPGTIEMVQALVLLSTSTAIVAATISRSHAKVRLLLNRLHGKPADWLRTGIAIGGTLFFLALAAGGAWVIVDLWGGAEQSETLHIPYLPLRLYAAACMLVTAALYAARLFRRGNGP